MPYRKSIPKPDLGVDASQQGYEISPRAWTIMQQMRTRLGKVTNFPGWASILDPSVKIDGNLATFLGHFRQFDGTTFLIVGGGTKLYRYVPGTKSLADISGQIYSPSRDNPWYGFFFLDSYYITNRIDGLHKFNGVGNFSLINTAPKARCGVVLNEHILVLNTVEDDGEHAQRVRWAAEATDDDWTATSNNDAGKFDLTDSGDVGIAMHKIANDAIIYMDHSIVPITYVGGNEVFGQRQTLEKIGLIGQEAIANIGDRHIFMEQDSFCEYNGGATINRLIGIKIEDKVYPNLHPVFKNRSKTLILQDTHEIIFFYPSTTSEGECDQAVVLNTVTGEWYGPFPILVTATCATERLLTKVINQDNELINSDNSPINLNLDIAKSRFNLFADANGDIHAIGESQSANGQPITRILESGDHFMGADLQTEGGKPVSPPAGSVFQVGAVNLELENIVANEPIQMFVGVRMDLAKNIVYKGPYTIRSHSSQRARVPVRATGRWFRLRFVLPNNARLGLLGYQYECEIVGVR